MRPTRSDDLAHSAVLIIVFVLRSRAAIHTHQSVFSVVLISMHPIVGNIARRIVEVSRRRPVVVDAGYSVGWRCAGLLKLNALDQSRRSLSAGQPIVHGGP